MRKCSSTILYAACTFQPYKSTPVLKLFRTFTGRMTRGLSLRMVFSLLFQDTLFIGTKCWGNIPLLVSKAKATIKTRNKTLLFVGRKTLHVSMPRRLDIGLY